MTTPCRSRMIRARWIAGFAALLFGTGSDTMLLAQKIPAIRPEADGQISVAVTFDATAANLTSANNFWLKGGTVDLNRSLCWGLGVTASFTGLHTGNSGGGVPLSFVAPMYGLSYNLRTQVSKHAVRLLTHGMIGEAYGFSGVYPQALSATSNAHGLAAKVGGGVDVGPLRNVGLWRNVSVRALEANWLHTQLPNGTTNVQNDFQLSTGVVYHFNLR